MARKLPALTAESKWFWQGGQHDRLLIHYCSDCSRYFHPPGPVCPGCTGDNISPRQVSGNGAVATYTINHQQWRPDLNTPYVVAIVELAEQEGLQLVTNIINCDPERVHVGMPVKVTFHNQEDVWIPLFEEDV